LVQFDNLFIGGWVFHRLHLIP